MTRTASLALMAILLLLGCPGGEVTVDDDDSAADDDDTGDDDTTWTGDPVEDVTWQVHKTVGSLIVVSWEQMTPATVSVEFRVDTEWRSSPPRNLEPGPQQELLLGVPYDHDVSFRVLADPDGDAWASEEQTAHTDEAPSGVFPSTLLSGDDTAWEPSLQYVVAAISWNRGWTVIVDRQARLVWAQQTPQGRTTLYSRPSYDGADILVDHNSYWAIFDDGDASQIQRLKIDGSVVATYDTPGLHHPFVELDDGSLVWGAADGYTETVEKLTPAGVQESLWSCEDYHDQLGVTEYCQSNTLFWNEADDTFLFSLYSDETIVEIDHATGQSLRWFGHMPGAWTFDPPDSAFHWQHGGHYTDTGTLITSSHASGDSNECVVREYELDEGGEVLTEVWDYGLGNGINAPVMGEVHRLPNGNTLHNYGSGGRLREVMPDGALVWEVLWEGQLELGRTTPVEDLYAFAP